MATTSANALSPAGQVPVKRYVNLLLMLKFASGGGDLLLFETEPLPTPPHWDTQPPGYSLIANRLKAMAGP